MDGKWRKQFEGTNMAIRKELLVILLIITLLYCGCLTKEVKPKKNRLEVIFEENVTKSQAIELLSKYNVTITYQSNTIIILNNTKLNVLQFYIKVNNEKETETILNKLNKEPIVYLCKYEGSGGD